MEECRCSPGTPAVANDVVVSQNLQHVTCWRRFPGVLGISTIGTSRVKQSTMELWLHAHQLGTSKV